MVKLPKRQIVTNGTNLSPERSRCVAAKGKNVRFYVFLQKHRSGYGIAAEVLTDTLINARLLFGVALGRQPPTSQIHDYSGMDWWYINSMEVGKVRLLPTEVVPREAKYYDAWASPIKKKLTISPKYRG